MIFFDQFKVPTTKFGKCFAEFMIPIALVKVFDSSKFVKSIEVILKNMRRCSGRANKLRYINKNKKFRSFKSKENIHKKGRRWAIPRFQLHV